MAEFTGWKKWRRVILNGSVRLRELGWTVIRVTNDQVYEARERLIEAVRWHAQRLNG